MLALSPLHYQVIAPESQISDKFSDRPGLRNVEEIRKLNEAVCTSLQKELLRSQNVQPIKEEVPAISLLINKRHTLRSDQRNPLS